MKNAVFWDVSRVALIRTDVSEESSVHLLLVIANVVPSSPILVTLMMEVLGSSETSVLTRLQEPHGVTSQKTTFFIVTAVKTSNFT
jgi:hypothetical protein